MMNLRQNLLIIIAVLTFIVTVFPSQRASAVEGAFDYYLPGIYGNIGVADFPEPGAYYLNFMAASKGEVDITVKNGQVHTDVKDSIFAQVFVPAYLSEKKILGGNYWLAAALVLPEYVDLKSNIQLSNGLSVSSDESTTGLGDMTIIPFGLQWKNEDWAAVFYSSVNVPIGYYSLETPATLGLNYWALDLNYAMTIDVTEKFNIDFDIGLLLNTENTDTDYHSGNSVHLDYTFGYHLTHRFSLGLSGYVYHQLNGDSGSGATLGDFKGRAYGIGPSVEYIWGNKDFFVVGNLEWLHDLDTENRIESDYVIFMLALPI